MARRHFQGGLDSGEAGGKQDFTNTQRHSGLKIRAKRRKKQQPWALGGAGASSLCTDPLADKPTPAHHPLCVPGDPPPTGPWDPLCSLGWPSRSQESQGPGGVRVVLQAHPCRGNQYKKHRPASPSPSKSLEEASTQAPSGEMRVPTQPRPDSRGQCCQHQVRTATAPGPRTPGLSLPWVQAHCLPCCP